MYIFERKLSKWLATYRRGMLDMKDYVVKQGKKLEIGYTTGTCAAVAAKASAQAVLSGEFEKSIRIEVPAGITFDIEINHEKLEQQIASCAVRKYSGDDPDVTDGMLIYASVEKIESRETDTLQSDEEKQVRIIIEGGEGIGQVTRKGLSCEVGKAAINPIPRAMIEKAVLEEINRAGYNGKLKVIIWAPEGRERAKKTFNERLGILGGISILGTSGVVEPMSEDALIETIKIEMNQHDRDKILFASPGNYGLDFAQSTFQLDMNQSVKYSNYIGEFLDHAVYLGFKKILLIGHVGKMIKLASGTMNTHSKVADSRQEIMVAHCALHGVEKEKLKKIMQAISVDEMHQIMMGTGLDKEIYRSIAEKITFHLNYRVRNEIEVEFIGFSNQYGLLLESDRVRTFIEEIRTNKNI